MITHKWTDPAVVDRYLSERTASEADGLVVDRIRELAPDRLIELGTGPGTVLRNCGFIRNYIATDLSMAFLTRLNAKLSVCCSADLLPFAAGCADCVLAMAVLHHLDRFQLQDSLRGIHKVLKPGAMLLLLEDWCFARGETPFEEEARKFRFRNGTVENHLAEESWLEELEAAGFKCCARTWVGRPFHTQDKNLLKWKESERKVRMLLLEMEKYQ